MAELFVDYRGYSIKRHSNSGGDDWEMCRRKYQLSRKLGWKPRAVRASMEFGKCVEEAVQAYVLNLKLDPVELFLTNWNKLADKEITYSDDECDWSTQAQVGRELMLLFKIKLPSLPIIHPEIPPAFQQAYEREMFPGTSLSGIKFKAILDIVTAVDWNHPMLPSVVEQDRKSPLRPLIIDMKCSAKMLKLSHPAMIVLDQQLRAYSWITAIKDTAFLWFAKAGLGLKCSYDVTLLESAGQFAAGTPMYLADTIKDETKEIVQVWLLPDNREVLKALDDYCFGLKGKAYDTKYADFVKNAGVLAPVAAITRQRIQFFAGRIPDELAAESGRMIAQQIAEIHDAAKRDFFPRQSGIRFPNNKCDFCDYRGICINDDKLRDALVWQPDEAWLSELGKEEDNPELVKIDGVVA